MGSREAFTILEIDRPNLITPESLREIYRDLVKVWHPDIHQSSPRLREKAEKKLKAINEAYHTACLYLEKVENLRKQIELRAGELKKAEDDLSKLRNHAKRVQDHARKLQNKIDTATETRDDVLAALQGIQQRAEELAKTVDTVIEEPEAIPSLGPRSPSKNRTTTFDKIVYALFITLCLSVYAFLGSNDPPLSLLTIIMINVITLAIVMVPWTAKLIQAAGKSYLRRKKERATNNVL